MSSRGSDGRRSSRRGTRLGDLAGARAGTRSEQRLEVGLRKRVLGRIGVGQAVRVEEQAVRGSSSTVVSMRCGSCVRAQHDAVRSDLLDGAVAPQQQRERMAPGRARQPGSPAGPVQARVDDRAQLALGALVAKRVVENGQDAARTLLVDGRGSQRVARQTRYGRRPRTLPAHVADDHRPAAVAGLEHVVEVAAHLVARADRSEAGREFDARDLGQARGEQALLQRARDLLDRLLGPPALGDDRGEQQHRDPGDREVGLGEQQAVVGDCCARTALRRWPCRRRRPSPRRGSPRPRRAARSAGPPRRAGERRGR